VSNRNKPRVIGRCARLLGPAIAIVVLTGGTAVAATAGNVAPGKAPVAVPSLTDSGNAPVSRGVKAPPGYVVEYLGFTATENNAQTQGEVDCPSGTVAWGGGVLMDTNSAAININSSLPNEDGTIGWNVDVNNSSQEDANGTVFAVCADQPTDYSIQFGSMVTNSAGTETLASASCPARTVVLGGGGVSTSILSSVNLNGSFPASSHRTSIWDVYENNASTSNFSVTAVAICGKKPRGYSVNASSPVDNPSGTDTEVAAACPNGAYVVGGGLSSSSFSTAVNLNSTKPNVTSWISYENNASLSDDSITGYAVCAK
jgi:hypothetical protein